MTIMVCVCTNVFMNDLLLRLLQIEKYAIRLSFTALERAFVLKKYGGATEMTIAGMDTMS